jgi:hypothetical protein
VALLVIVAELRVAAPFVVSVSVVILPVLVMPFVVAAPLTVTVERLVLPVTARVPLVEVLPVVLSTVNTLEVPLLTARPPPCMAAPPFRLAAPVTLSVPPTVALLVIVAELRVAAPFVVSVSVLILPVLVMPFVTVCDPTGRANVVTSTRAAQIAASFLMPFLFTEPG